MALSVCLDCSTAYAAGLSGCPHCQSTDFVEQGQPMPKITRHGGPSTGPEEVPPSPGNSSSTSPEKPQTRSEPSKSNPRKRAPATGSRSGTAAEEGSTAPSAGGDPASDN